MELSVMEFARCLNLPQSIIERWIRQGRIPVKRRGDLLVFSLTALNKWAVAHNLRFVGPGEAACEIAEQDPETLLSVMQCGGIYYDVPGGSVEDVLRAAVDRMAAIDSVEERQVLYDNLMSREQMMSTGIGNGVAIPHPRTPVTGRKTALIATCFLEKPIPYHAIDKQPVFVLFVLVAPTAKLHLHLLSRISFCLRDNGFLKLLVQIPDQQSLFAAIAEFDRRLDTPGG